MKRRFYLLLELPVAVQAKIHDKMQFLDGIQGICSAGGADSTIIKSYYMDAKSPERLHTFEVVLLIFVSDSAILEMKDVLKRWCTYEPSNVYPRIFIKRKKGLWLDITSLSNDKNILNKLTRKKDKSLAGDNMVKTIQDFEIIKDDAHE